MSKVTVIGAGNVGATCANAIAPIELSSPGSFTLFSIEQL